MSINEVVESEGQNSNANSQGDSKPKCMHHDLCRNYEERDMYCNQYQGHHGSVDLTFGKFGCYNPKE